MCFLFYSSLICISAYAKVYLKTTIIKQNIKIILIAGVPSSQALPGFLITAPPSVCVSAVLGVLTVWIQKKGMFFLHFWRHQRNNYFGARWTRAHLPVAFLHGSDVVHTIFTLEPFRSRFQTENRNRSLSGMFCRISFIPNH